MGLSDREPIFGIPPDLQIGPGTDVLALSGETNWGMEAFGVERLRALGGGGFDTIVGVVDTGVDRSHPLLSGCFAARDFTGSPYGAADRHGHGTHCTGTVGANSAAIGVNPKARTVHGKGLSDSGSGAGSWIRDAMLWCVDQGAEIVSMSLGSSGEDRTITDAIRRLAERGIWVVCAAGNSGPNTPDVDWPGRSPFCLSVAALNTDFSPASFSSAGAKIDTSGAGVNIWSARPGGGYQQMSGTSMATPFIAGMLSLYRGALKAAGRPIPTLAEVRTRATERSTDTHPPGRLPGRDVQQGSPDARRDPDDPQAPQEPGAHRPHHGRALTSAAFQQGKGRPSGRPFAFQPADDGAGLDLLTVALAQSTIQTFSALPNAGATHAPFINPAREQFPEGSRSPAFHRKAHEP